MNDDLISRKAAIGELTENKEMINAVLDSLTLDYNTRRNQEQRRGQINEDIETIKALPSAQPATNCSEFPNTSDVVSRKAVREMVSTWAYDMAEWEDMELALHDVDELPTAQPEVIHCKDCKHLQKWRSEESAKKFGQIYECARNVFDCPKPEDFCSHAERKQK